MGGARRTLDRRRGGRKEVCCVSCCSRAYLPRVGPGSRGLARRREGREEASGGVRLVTFARSLPGSAFCSASVFLGHMPLFHSLKSPQSPQTTWYEFWDWLREKARDSCVSPVWFLWPRRPWFRLKLQGGPAAMKATKLTSARLFVHQRSLSSARPAHDHSFHVRGPGAASRTSARPIHFAAARESDRFSSNRARPPRRHDRRAKRLPGDRERNPKNSFRGTARRDAPAWSCFEFPGLPATWPTE